MVIASRPGLIAMPGQEFASVFAHRPVVVELSVQHPVQHSVQRSEAVSGTGNRPVAVEELEVEGPHLWAVVESKAGDLSREHFQAVSNAVAAAGSAVAVAAVFAASVVLAVSAASAAAVDWACSALAAWMFAASAEESKRPAQKHTTAAVAQQ